MSAYLQFAINSPQVRAQFPAITTGVAQQKVSLARFRRSIVVPIPPIGEQEHIINMIERRTEELTRIETAVSKEITRSSRLRRSILAAAFSGRLVHQDPGDEPASLLLERTASDWAAYSGRGPNTKRAGRREVQA
jgi:type I restriction enzyme S subunit